MLAEEAVRLDWLQPTNGCEKQAVISVVPEASSRQSSVCHRIRKFDPDIGQGLHGLEEYGFASAPARSWDSGARCFVRGFMLGLDKAAACFGGSITGESSCRRRYERNVTPSIAVNSLTLRGKAGFEYAVPG